MVTDSGGRTIAPVPASPPAERRRAARAGMNKTGARILGGFVAAFLAWVWQGWGEPATGVPLGDAMATTLGGARIVLTEWVLVKEPSGGR